MISPAKQGEVVQRHSVVQGSDNLTFSFQVEIVVLHQRDGGAMSCNIIVIMVMIMVMIMAMIMVAIMVRSMVTSMVTSTVTNMVVSMVVIKVVTMVAW